MTDTTLPDRLRQMIRERAPEAFENLIRSTYGRDYAARGEVIEQVWVSRDPLGNVISFDICSSPPRPACEASPEP